MNNLSSVHFGIISHNKDNHSFIKSTRPTLIKEMNEWFFQYFTVRSEKILQLPPLDDWRRSKENPNLWYISFPNNEWNVSIDIQHVDD